MMAEKVTPDTFNPPHHELSTNIQHELDVLLKEYESQFAKDEISIGTTPLTSMMIDTGLLPRLSETLPHHYEALSIGERGNWKLLTAKVIYSSRSIWSVLIIVVPKGDRGKHLVIDYRALNKVTRKFTWPMPKVEDIFSRLNGATYFTTLDLQNSF